MGKTDAMTTGAAEAKTEIRSRHRLARALQAGGDHTTLADGLARHGLAWAGSVARPGIASFAVYLGVGTEPPTSRLVESLNSHGYRVLLPVCEPGRQLLWVEWTPQSTFARSRFAPILEPVGPRFDLADSSAVLPGGTELAGIILPATAVDRSGNRIGQGGGYYDAFLAAMQEKGNIPPTVAVVYDDEVLPPGAIPAEPFDMKVQAALTPGGLVTF